MRKKVLITGGSGLLALNWAITDKHKYDITLSYHKRKFIIEGVNLIKVKSADEMLEATLNSLPVDVAIFSSAVADFKIKNKKKRKNKKK